MKCWALILAAVEIQGTCAMVSIAATKGSVPREADARMVVTLHGFYGTIGGGALEWQALAKAQSLLGRGVACKVTSHALGPELGQCCGGRVDLITESFDHTSVVKLRDLAAREQVGIFTMTNRHSGITMTETFGQFSRPLYVFGAGHVGRALVLALAPLPFSILWIDPRPNAFPGATPANTTLIRPEDPISCLATTTPGSFVLILTHSHSLDFSLTDAALRNRDIIEVGLIGSATKRARFENRLRAAQCDEERIAQLICPIGIPGISSKEPAMIAAATASQLLILDQKHKVQNAIADEMPKHKEARA